MTKRKATTGKEWRDAVTEKKVTMKRKIMTGKEEWDGDKEEGNSWRGVVGSADREDLTGIRHCGA